MLTFSQHVEILEQARPMTVDRDNFLSILNQYAAILGEQNIPQEDRWVVFPVLVKQPRSKKRRIEKKWRKRNLSVFIQRVHG